MRQYSPLTQDTESASMPCKSTDPAPDGGNVDICTTIKGIIHGRSLGIDIGGTLIKLARLNSSNSLELKHFNTDNLDDLWKWIKESSIDLNGKIVRLTGGGAVRFIEIIENGFKEYNTRKLERVDEMRSAVLGLNTIIRAHEVMCSSGSGLSANLLSLYDLKLGRSIPLMESLKRSDSSTNNTESLYPYLLVNIGSGVSMIKVKSDTEYERVTGTCLGGGTALGIAHICSNVQTFEELLELSAQGSSWLDLTIGELEGDAAGANGVRDKLPPDAIATAFGRLYVMGGLGDDTLSSIGAGDSNRTSLNSTEYSVEASNKKLRRKSNSLPDEEIARIKNGLLKEVRTLEWKDDESDAESVDQEEISYLESEQFRRDFSYSVVQMISYNLGYLSYLVSHIAKCETVFFTGKYVAAHPLNLKTLTYAMNFCADNYPIESSFRPNAYFCDNYDGYIGAIGALVADDES